MLTWQIHTYALSARKRWEAQIITTNIEKRLDHFENVQSSSAGASSARELEAQMNVFLCRSLLFLQGRGPTAMGFLRRNVETSSTAWQLMPQATKGTLAHTQHLPVSLPGNEGNNPSWDSACRREEFPKKIQTTLGGEMTTMPGPMTHLGKEILVALWTPGNFCSFREKLQPLQNAGKLPVRLFTAKIIH